MLQQYHDWTGVNAVVLFSPLALRARSQCPLEQYLLCSHYRVLWETGKGEEFPNTLPKHQQSSLMQPLKAVLMTAVRVFYLWP